MEFAKSVPFINFVRAEVNIPEIGDVHLAQRIDAGEQVAPEPELLEGRHVCVLQRFDGDDAVAAEVHDFEVGVGG